MRCTRFWKRGSERRGLNRCESLPRIIFPFSEGTLISDQDLDLSRKAGIDDGLMLEIVANVALHTLTNYANRSPIRRSTPQWLSSRAKAGQQRLSRFVRP
jgi:hypothetical protein